MIKCGQITVKHLFNIFRMEDNNIYNRSENIVHGTGINA